MGYCITFLHIQQKLIKTQNYIIKTISRLIFLNTGMNIKIRKKRYNLEGYNSKMNNIVIHVVLLLTNLEAYNKPIFTSNKYKLEQK